MNECIFCAIARREKPADVVYEDERVMAFDDIKRNAPVHILVIPKEHVQSIAHLTDNHSDVIAHLIYTAKRIAGEKGLAGYKILFNVGREGGQMVDHLHLHLFGGWENLEGWKKTIIASL